MTEAELKQYLETSERNPKLVAAAVLGVPDATLRWKPAPDKWCILEIIAHLADIEIVYACRLRQMLADTNPVIAPMHQNAWAQKLGYMQSSPAEMVALYGLNRHANLQLLRRMKLEDLSKSAHHPETNCQVAVAEMVERMSTHGTKHLEQIERLKTDSSKIAHAKTHTTLRPN